MNLNFGRHLWKGNLTVKIELLKLEDFLERLQKSWDKAKKSMKIAQENMKRQFDKKRRNPQELKVGENVWLEANIHSNKPSKKLDQKNTDFLESQRILAEENFN